MLYKDNGVSGVKLAYIGGGSRGWAWTLMNDLAKAENMSGTVALYDIDFTAAQHNEVAVLGEVTGPHERDDQPAAQEGAAKGFGGAFGHGLAFQAISLGRARYNGQVRAAF